MSILKKIILVGTVFILCLFSYMGVSADEGGYKITNYDFKGTYHKDNTVSVKETIDVEFWADRHGIYRSIPLIMSVKRKLDDNSEKVLNYKNDVKNVNVKKWNYDTSTKDNYYNIKIGSSSSYVSGKQRYVITYDYQMPDDRVDNGDVIYYSVLGADWDCDIDIFTFEMKFDKAVTDQELDTLKVFSGGYGRESDELGVGDFLVATNKTISGGAQNIGRKNAITLHMDVREGYFVGEKTRTGIFSYFFLVLAVGLSVLTLLYVLIKRNKKPVVTVEFYPPENFSSAEVGMAIDEKADDEDLISLIPWWAEKGYLTIEEVPDKKGRGGEHATLTLHKVKDLPDTVPNYQRTLFKALFTSDSRSLKSLPVSFAEKFDTAKSNLQGVFVGDKTLTSGYGKGWGIVFLINLMYFAALALSSPVSYLDNLIFASFSAVPLLFVGWMRVSSKRKDRNRQGGAWFKHILVLAIFALVSLGAMYLATEDNYLSFKTWLIVFAIVLVANVMSGRFLTYTDYGLEIIGKLEGLRNFIKTAEVDKLKMLVDENPSYFFDILPYAMVFGLSDHWSKQFKSLTIKAPSWYYGYNNDMFTIWYLHSMLSRNISTPIHDVKSKAAMQKAASSASSGGFSGGGGGGGGGGSW